MRFFIPSVPAGRLEYFLIILAMNVAQYFALTKLLRFEVVDPLTRQFNYDATNLTVFAFIIFGTFAVSMITVVRRLTSLNMSGTWVVALFIPIISLFFQLWLLLAKAIGASTIAPFGDDPYNPDSWVEKPKPGTSGPVVTYQGQALRLPGEGETWGKDAA